MRSPVNEGWSWVPVNRTVPITWTECIIEVFRLPQFSKYAVLVIQGFEASALHTELELEYSSRNEFFAKIKIWFWRELFVTFGIFFCENTEFGKFCLSQGLIWGYSRPSKKIVIHEFTRQKDLQQWFSIWGIFFIFCPDNRGACTYILDKLLNEVIFCYYEDNKSNCYKKKLQSVSQNWASLLWLNDGLVLGLNQFWSTAGS